MSTKKAVPIVLSLILLVTMLTVTSQSGKRSLKSSKIRTATQDTATDDEKEINVASAQEEVRGVWVSYMELDMQNETDKSAENFRNKFEKIALNSKEFGFNTLIVQVRPFSDALYDSEYFPYSHILSGVQGENPGYDALKIMCEVCNNYGLSIHAWINPYRIQTKNTPQTLAETNPYELDKSIGCETDDGIYYDPSDKKARELIINGVVEIAENYDIDGIQFDDYFYPTRDEAFDSDEYAEYVEEVGTNSNMSLDNWRYANVNILICDTYRAIHSLDKEIEFGISPQGNIDNNAEIYADVKSWCTCKGFVDYICPQIYFSLENPTLTFEDCLNSWLALDFNENVSLYVGLAGYKAGNEDYDENTWLNTNDILSKEYQIIKNNENIDGMMLYSYASIENKTAAQELDNLKKVLN